MLYSQNSQEIDRQKKVLRTEIREQRKKLSDPERSLKSKMICELLLKDLALRPVGKIFSYLALKEEPDLEYAMAEAARRGWKVYVPFVQEESIMVAARYQGEMERTSLGVYQPKKAEWIAPEEISLFWIPGVAFDSQGYRLGMGGGYYDRFLEKAKGTFIGVGWSFQMKDQVPSESHDIPMDFLVDETKMLKVAE